MEENPANLESCSMPVEPPAEELVETLSQRNRLLVDLAVMAFSCDQTRVWSDFLTHPVHNFVFPGTDAGQHQLTHDELDPQPMVHDTVLQSMEEFRYMVEALNAVPEGEETLLDHCSILATSDVSLGRTHALDEFPIVTAGKGGGALKTGIHYRSETRESASHVMLSLIRSMGIVAPSFGGEEARVTEGLGALEA